MSENPKKEYDIKKIDPSSYSFQLGDHLCVKLEQTPPIEYKSISINSKKLPKFLHYWHHGIYCGPDEKGISRIVSLSHDGITLDDIQSFGDGCLEWGIKEHTYEKNSRADCVKRAMYFFYNGDKTMKKYNLKNHNCEHFTNLVIEEKNESEQVESWSNKIIKGMKVAGAGAAMLVLGAVCSIILSVKSNQKQK